MADEIVGRLGAEIFLDDEQVAGAAKRASDQFDQVGDALEGLQTKSNRSGNALAGMNPKSRQASRGLQELSFFINDAQQFQVSFAAGVRATSNQIPGLINAMGLASRVANPLILALSAATTAVVLFGDETKTAGNIVDDTTESVESLTDSMLKVPKASQFKFDDEGALEQAKRIQALGDALDTYIENSSGKSREEIETLRERQAFYRGLATSIEEATTQLRTQQEIARFLSGTFEEVDESGRKMAERLERRLAQANRFIERFAAGIRFDVDTKAAESLLEQAIDRLNRRTQQLQQRDFTLRVSVDPGTESFDELAVNLVRADRAARTGLVPTLDALRERAEVLRVGLRDLSDTGEQNSVMFGLLQDDLQQVDRLLRALEITDTFAAPFSEGLSNILFGLGRANDLLEAMKLSLRDVVAEYIRSGLVKLGARVLGGVLGGLAGGPGGAITGATVGGFPGLGRALIGPQDLNVSVVGTARGGDLVFVQQEQARFDSQ